MYGIDAETHPSFIEVLEKLQAATEPRTGLVLKITTKVIPANTSTLLTAQNSKRRYLGIVVTGTGRININVDTSAVLNQGWPVAAASELGDQGGSLVWDADTVPSNAFYCIAPVATTVIVMEG